MSHIAHAIIIPVILHVGMLRLGMERKLQNYVFKCMQTMGKSRHPLSSLEHSKEPISYIRKSQVCLDAAIYNYIYV